MTKGFFLTCLLNCQCFFGSRKAVLAFGLLPVSLRLHLFSYLHASWPFCFVEPVCEHVHKGGLGQGHLKKALLNVQWHVCQDCQADNKTQEKSAEETDESPSIWLCLKCGHRVSMLICLNIFQYLVIQWNKRPFH